MKKIITSSTTPAIILITAAFLIFAGCQGPESQTAPSETSSKNAETKSKVAITIEPSKEVPAPATDSKSTVTEPVSTGEPSAWTAEEGDLEAENPPYANIYMVALEDNGKSGPAVGCGDSLVGAKVKYVLTKDENTARDMLTKLFAVKQQYYGESGLYNALYQSDLKVDSLTADANKKATLKLSGTMQLGGVCDNPRFEGQIRETVLQFKDLYSVVEIFVNDKPLKELLSEK